MKDKRRLILVGRQLQLTKVARREAIGALADALKEEGRSAELAKRSQNLADEYARRRQVQDAHTLTANMAFSQSLQHTAQQADAATKDARQQVDWQMQTLATAETRATRLEEQMKAARREVEALTAKREFSQSIEPKSRLARKLQSGKRGTSNDPQF